MGWAKPPLTGFDRFYVEGYRRIRYGGCSLLPAGWASGAFAIYCNLLNLIG